MCVIWWYDDNSSLKLVKFFGKYCPAAAAAAAATALWWLAIRCAVACAEAAFAATAAELWWCAETGCTLAAVPLTTPPTAAGVGVVPAECCVGCSSLGTVKVLLEPVPLKTDAGGVKCALWASPLLLLLLLLLCKLVLLLLWCWGRWCGRWLEWCCCCACWLISVWLCGPTAAACGGPTPFFSSLPSKLSMSDMWKPEERCEGGTFVSKRLLGRERVWEKLACEISYIC